MSPIPRARTLLAIESVWRDVQFGIRMLRKHPTFTMVAVVTLAVGLGSTTAVFTVGNWMVLRPVPGIRDPGPVSLLRAGSPNQRGSLSISRVSYPNYIDLADRLKTIRLAGIQGLSVNVAAQQQPPRVVPAEFVTASYFSVLGVTMQAGRGFTATDDDPGNPVLVAVLSDRLWASVFNRNPAIIHRTLTVNGHSVSVVGVAARGFEGARRMSQVDLWLPGASYPVLTHAGTTYDDRARGGYYEFVARLTPGSTWPQAEAELQSLTRWLTEQHPAENVRFKTASFQNLGSINSYGKRQLLLLFALMMGATTLVLLITCSNVAGLLLIRGVGRHDEVAVRRALGASRSRLVRQQTTESVMLWLIGGASGLLLVWLLTRMAAGSSLAALGVRDVQIPIDWRVATFAAALSLGIGLLFSILPAVRAMRVEVTDVLKTGGRLPTRSGFALGSILTVFQLAASLTLLVGALLLTATLRHLIRIDLGFQPDEVTLVQARPASIGYNATAAFAYYRDFVERLASRAGIESVSIAKEVPFYGSRSNTRIRKAGRPDEETLDEVPVNQVLSASYFRTLGIRVIRGRPFTDAEIPIPGREALPAVILSESLARQLFGSTDAIGQAVEIPLRGRERRRYDVVGVAADVRFYGLSDEYAPMLYDPAGISLPSSALIVVRTVPPFDPMAELQAIATSLDRRIPVEVFPMTQMIERARFEWDLLASLLTLLAGVASVLAAVGVYGIVAFAVAARRGEFGIRMALGATPGAVRRLVLDRAFRLAAGGLFIGFGGAVAVAHLLRARLVGVQPFDPVIWSQAAIALVAIVILASWIPARQATRASVAETLRAL
ncbi:MAG: ABC transporter permease [Acidobacteria bacterium]|nr:ABC transporter permease [Acidobacteriota bacterium]